MANLEADSITYTTATRLFSEMEMEKKHIEFNDDDDDDDDDVG